MPSWEETKRARQTAFTLGGNLLQDIHSSVSSTYQQILMTGRIYPTIGPDNLTQQIVDDMYKQPEQEQEPLFYLNHFHDYGQDQDIEPER